MQNMVEARNANYATIVRHLCFGKRGAANVEPEISAAGAGRADKARHAADTIDNGSDSDDEMPPEPKLLRVSASHIVALHLSRDASPWYPRHQLCSSHIGPIRSGASSRHQNQLLRLR